MVITYPCWDWSWFILVKGAKYEICVELRIHDTYGPTHDHRIYTTEVD